MRHAFLIMAHNEFGVLQKLVEALDDRRNDIFVHVDSKVNKLPLLKTQAAGLTYTKERVGVRWGSVSQIKAEYTLFEEAFRSGEMYCRYHLISGTHLPLKTQDDIHLYFAKANNKESEVLRFIYTNNYEVNMKLGRYHFFLKGYQHRNLLVKWWYSRLWYILLKFQYIFRIQRKCPIISTKANNWVSLTHKAVEYIVQSKEQILVDFRWSFCGDEFFVPYLLETASERFCIINDQKLLYDDIQQNANARVLSRQDYRQVIDSGCLFARKFSEQHMDVIDNILENIKP